MHARELIELAAIVTAQGPVLLQQKPQLSATALGEYWAHSKCRLDRWSRSVKQFKGAHESPQGVCAPWTVVRGIFEEVLTGEILTRVWTAVLCAHDRVLGASDVEPVARSVMLGHAEARNRVLTLLVSGKGMDAEEALRLNRLRRRSERWIDMLIGYLCGIEDLSEFAIDPDRAKDFAEDISYQSRLAGGHQAWPLLQTSLRAAFRTSLHESSPNCDLNEKIASSILSCFQSDLFDSTGMFRSLWMHRLTNIADDAQGMLDDLLATSPSFGDSDAAEPLSTRLEDRLRPLGE